MKINAILDQIERTLYSNSDDGTGVGPKSADASEFMAGDVEILDISIFSEDQQRSYSLMTMCKSFVVHESILSPVIYAELNCIDPNGIRQSFPFIGEEYVVISFKTPGTTSETKYFLRVNAVVGVNLIQGNKTQTYTLQCCSAEVLRNASTTVSKRFDAPASDCIEELLTDPSFLGTQKPFIKEPSKGVFSGICPANPHAVGSLGAPTPFVAIDYLRRYHSASSRYLSSSYVFFENKHGFNFVTIEKMMEDGEKLIAAGGSDKEFFMDSNSKLDMRNVTVRDILAYNQPVFASAVSKVQSGAQHKIVNNLDLITMNVTRLNYVDNEGADTFRTADGPSSAAPTTTTFQRTHGTTTAVSVARFTRSDRPETYYPEKMSIISSYANKLTQNITQTHVYGDSDVTVGDMIKCSFPSTVESDDTTGVSRLDSGNYLVAKLCHIIINSDRPQHTMSFELIKGGFTEN